MNKNMIIVAVLVVLVLISIVQAVQLFKLKDGVSNGNVKTGASTQTVATQQQKAVAAQAPSNIQNLPQMVGGC